MIEWHKVTDDSDLPMVPHGQDSCTARMLVYVDNPYYPNVFFGYYDYEDGGHWSVDGIEKGWTVTHWALEPEAPKPELNESIVSDAPWNHRTSTP
jgi:hypothetical protein